jgi:hypothetical protein
MKTRIIAIGLIAGILSLGQNIHAAPPAEGSERTATFTHRHRAVETQPPPPGELRSEVNGVIPRAIRGGSPLQMLNPFAPAIYGTGEGNVALDPDVPGKGTGIKLLSFSF